MIRSLCVLALICFAIIGLRPYPQTDPSLVVFPSAEAAFIVGPQVKSGTSQISGAEWFDQNAINRGLTLCSAFPDVAHTPGNVLISGTVSVTKGSKIVTGGGTKFLTEVKDYAIIQNGPAGRIVKIKASVESDTQLTLTLPWEGETLTSQQISSPTANDVDNYQGYLNYYDFGLVAYTNYYRTGDQRFLDCARKVTDSWWSQPVIDNGKNLVSLSGNSLAPRSVALNGLILRALDGRPEMWPWITDYVRYQFNGWVEVPTGWVEKDPLNAGLYFGIRDGGFMTLYAAEIGAVHPDPAIRAEFKAKVLRSAGNYYATLQKADGSYRWNDDSFPFTGCEQPFQVGILNEGMIAVHRLTGDDRVKAAILKSVEHEFLKSYSANGWRAMYYFVHGSIGAGTDLRNCESGCGNAANNFPPADGSQIDEARQLNATAISQFGYAYSISGDVRFKQWGDEIFDATYAGKDGHRGLASARGKEYDESYRSGGKYLAWRLGGSSGPLPSPSATVFPTPATPTPTAIPLPSPSVTPSGNVSADGTKGLTITDATGGTWTFGLNKETLRNGVHTGGGFGLVYKWLTGFVYVQGTNGAWYRWTGDSWAGAGDDEPGAPTPTPTAAPSPDVTPSPQPSPTVTPIPTATPTPTPPICVMTIVGVPTIPQWGSGKLVVSLSGFGSPSSVTATSTSGQVTISPPQTRTISGGSALVEFGLSVKKKSATVNVKGPCGDPKSVMVQVR